MGNSNYCDVLVIGGGGAGISAAFTSAGLGKSTILVERYRTGGECTWNGCIPSKALIHIAGMNHSSDGQNNENRRSVNPFPDIEKVRQQVYSHESPEVLAERGVKTIIGEARFIDPETIEVNNEKIKARRFILAVGSRAMVLPIPGLDKINYLTNENLFNQTRLPSSLIVMGGGPIGLEMAQALCRLGVKITVVEMLDRILFREDADTARIIEKSLKKDGVEIFTSTRGVKIIREQNEVSLTVESSDGQKQILKAENLLVAVGRQSGTTGLNLEAANVKTTPKGVQVNKYLRTTNKRIFAAGDVAGPFAFSHMAEYQGVTATMNAILPFRKSVNYENVAWVTFTDPEIAQAGMSEYEARKKYPGRIHVYTHCFEDLDRGRTAPGTEGLVKIILGPGWRILGAHIAGPRAGELIAEIQVLKTLKIPYYKLRNVIHPYPTYADILRQIAKKVTLDRLLNNPVVKLLRGSRS